jgi:hypothetical protein
MDVILDSNAYLSDIRMESIRFKNLFDYLRRTKSSLVLPRVIREETVAKYKHLLETQNKKAAQAVDLLNRLILDKDHRIHLNPPDVRYAVRDLRKKFRSPAKAVSVRYYPDTTNVDVGEIFLRGVKRRRPANADGEELRDVIIWLIALQFAQVEQKQIALVTADSGFWAEKEIHEHLRDDITKRNVKISLFRTIDDFIKDSAPAPVTINAEEVAKFFDVLGMTDAIITATKKALATWRRHFSQSFTVRSSPLELPTLAAGTVYEINAETKLAELSYDFLMLAEIEFPAPLDPYSPRMFSRIGSMSPPGMPLSNLMHANFPSILGLETHLQSSFQPILNSSGRVFVQTMKPENPTLSTYAISGKAQISVRLVNGALTEAELDGVDLLKVEELAKPEVAAPSVKS